MNDYSQSGEQEHILKAVGAEPGRFLEIGAYDGNHFSNTKALIERGWSGIMVEPALESFLALLKNHGENPNLQLVHALIGTERKLRTFWNTPGAVSTTEKVWFEKWKTGTIYHPAFLMPSITLQELLSWLPGPIDFLSIDTEGTSADLFLTFPLKHYHPRAFCVEYDGRLSEYAAYGQANGYRTIFTNTENLVMAHD